MILMKNIASIPEPKKYILATYDLKGSTYDRSVAVKDKHAIIKKKTLKDNDFKHIEGRLHLAEEPRKKF